MTPEQQRAYEKLVRLCLAHGLSTRLVAGPSGPGGNVQMVEIGHGAWPTPMQRLLFPDGTMV